MKVTAKDVTLNSTCSHCNKLGLIALADCTVISPMRMKAWKAKQNIALYKALWCFPGTVNSRAPNSLQSMGLSTGILRSNCLFRTIISGLKKYAWDHSRLLIFGHICFISKIFHLLNSAKSSYYKLNSKR